MNMETTAPQPTELLNPHCWKHAYVCLTVAMGFGMQIMIGVILYRQVIGKPLMIMLQPSSDYADAPATVKQHRN